jgi:ribonuclease P protein component
MALVTLKTSGQFKRVRGGARCATPLFIIEGKPRAGEDVPPSEARFGFIVSGKVGNAVVRNKVRRRLKEALRSLEGAAIRADHDYVVVASAAVHDYPFAGLQDALRRAFDDLSRQPAGGRHRRSVKSHPAAPRRPGGDVQPACTDVVERGARERSDPSHSKDERTSTRDPASGARTRR